MTRFSELHFLSGFLRRCLPDWHLSFRLILILTGAVLAGSCLMTAAYWLPSDQVTAGIKRSAQELNDYLRFSYDDTDSQGNVLDDYTDAIMFSMAYFYQDHLSAVTQAFDNRFIGDPAAKITGEGTAEQFADILMSQNRAVTSDSYARYWHGYLFFLRAGMMFFTWGQLQIILQFLVSALILFIGWHCWKSKQSRLLLPLLITVFSLSPGSLIHCLHYTQDFLIVLISASAYLGFQKFWRPHLPELMLLCGIGAAYFDFLAFPLITYGILMLLIVMTAEDFQPSELILVSLCWVGGYGLFWLSKWVLSSMILHRSLITEALASIRERTAPVGVTRLSGYLSCLQANLNLLLPAFLPLILWLSGCLAVYGRKKIIWNKIRLMEVLLVALIPFIWAFLAQNHCQIHAWFTFRIFSITLLAVALIPLCKNDPLI